ncbi:MAG TPA: tetratricopeptide repeat protein [Leeuwenhoekiella sp.]|nr:tetratricopeptide repeat protein [Leeuwenhoekiella sp.]
MRSKSLFFGKKELKTAVILTFCLFFNFIYSQTGTQYFKQGNTAYAAGNYQQAVDFYTKVLGTGQESATLYYNLGNANYKLNKIAPSVYNYERALRLKPNDTDIKNNLVFAQNMTIDAITPLPQNTFTKWYNAILNLLTIDGWATLTVVLILLFMGSFIAYRFVYTTTQKRLFFTTTFVTLVFGLSALFFAFKSQMRMENDRPAIVFSPTAEVRDEPKLSSNEAFVLHEGTKVLILSDNEEWQEIRLADGKEGWIPKTDVKEF